jgi:SAM-dependent methyltransferase
MRWVIDEIFEKSIEPFRQEIRSIAVVGGDADEPELQHFDTLNNVKVDFLGVDNALSNSNFHFLDLNHFSKTPNKYDLVLCSQVLEHVWDVQNALKNLVNLAKPNGLIWISCPASNFAHGSPHYFSAGYQPQLVINHLDALGAATIFQKTFGSRRNYFFTHSMYYWATERELAHPLFPRASRHYFKYFFMRVIATFLSNQTTSDPRFATETCVLSRRIQ